jgi:hypothetical protein
MLLIIEITFYAESGLSFSSFIWKLEKIKNNPENPVNPVLELK